MRRFDTAYLSNDGSDTSFSFNKTRLKFAASYSLEKYEKVLHWNNGYLEVFVAEKGLKYGKEKANSRSGY